MSNSFAHPRRNMLTNSLAAASALLVSTAVQSQTPSKGNVMSSQGGIKLIITFETKPDAVEPFAALMAQVKQDLPKVAGCRGVRVFQGKESPSIFTLLEDWDSETAHKVHIDQVISSGAWEKSIAIHLAKQPVSHYYTEYAARNA